MTDGKDLESQLQTLFDLKTHIVPFMARARSAERKYEKPRKRPCELTKIEKLHSHRRRPYSWHSRERDLVEAMDTVNPALGKTFKGRVIKTEHKRSDLADMEVGEYARVYIDRNNGTFWVVLASKAQKGGAQILNFDLLATAWELSVQGLAIIKPTTRVRTEDALVVTLRDDGSYLRSTTKLECLSGSRYVHYLGDEEELLQQSVLA